MHASRDPILEWLGKIHSGWKRVSIHWLYEHEPDLVTSAIETFGSLVDAAREAGFDAHSFLSGFDPGTSKSLNESFLSAVTGILEKLGIHLRKQHEFLPPKGFLDPVRVDQHGLWYIVKILPVSNLTRKLAMRILEIIDADLIVIYMKESPGIERISNVEFRHVNFYLQDVNDEELATMIRSIAACLNVVSFHV